MKEYNKRLKLIEFLGNKENRMLVIWFFTLISYVVLYLITKNTFVLFFSYFVLYLFFSRTYDFIFKKLTKHLDEEKKVVSFSDYDCK